MARKFGSGIYGRLEFDFACNRGHGFGEAYLHGVLIELLASNVNPRSENILPSHAVSVLQREPGGPGRKREVDFAVAARDDDQELLLCVEAKWAGSSHANAENVLYDVARLALVHQTHPTVSCLFVLAGGKDAVKKLLNSGVLAPHGRGRRGHQLLRYPHSPHPRRYNLTNGSGHTTALPTNLQTKLAKKVPTVPTRATSFLYKPTHDDPPDWRVYVWRIEA